MKEPPHSFESLFGRRFESFEESRAELIARLEHELLEESLRPHKLLALIAGEKGGDKGKAKERAGENAKAGESAVVSKIVVHKVF